MEPLAMLYLVGLLLAAVVAELFDMANLTRRVDTLTAPPRAGLFLPIAPAASWENAPLARPSLGARSYWRIYCPAQHK